jgi:regulator of sigma E protease
MTVLYLIYAILGISVIIFIHELGHFLAAKRVGVRVDRFSIGFDPTVFGLRLRVLEFRRGETVYVIGLIPFGGYVRLAGETAMDANAAKSAPQPDWLLSKSPGDRAQVFAAGATFNIISAFVFFAIAFSIGVSFLQPVIGRVEPGKPAWEAGLRPGDRILSIDGEEVSDFLEVSMAAAFQPEGRSLSITYQSAGGNEVRTTEVVPRWNPGLGFQTIGVHADLDPRVLDVKPGSAAAACRLGEGDAVIGLRVGALELTDLPSFELLWHVFASYVLERPGKGIEILVRKPSGSQEWILLSFSEKGKKRGLLGVHSTASVYVLRGVQKGSPLGEHFRAGDRIVSINGRPHSQLDLTILFDGTVEPHRPVTIEVQRQAGDIESIEIPSQPLTRSLIDGELQWVGLELEVDELNDTSAFAKAGLREKDVLAKVGQVWVANAADLRRELEATTDETVSCSVVRDRRILADAVSLPRRELLESLGSSRRSPLWVAAPIVGVLPESPAARFGIRTGSRILRIGDRRIERWEDLVAQVEAVRDEDFEVEWLSPAGEIRKSQGNLETTEYQDHGLSIQQLRQRIQTSFLGSFALGFKRMKVVSQQVFLTLKGLVLRRVEVKNLSGPVGIVHVIYRISEFGIGTLIYFMAMISVNLGILNLLPFPILDGGHLLFLLIEKIKGSPVDVRIQEIVTTIAFFLIIALALFVTFHDLRRLIVGS